MITHAPAWAARFAAWQSKIQFDLTHEVEHIHVDGN